MKNHIPTILLVLSVAFILLALPAQSFMASRGASQTTLDWTFGSCLTIGAIFAITVLCSLVPWSAFKPSNFRLK